MYTDGRGEGVISFIIDESHLRKLSPEARSELLQVIGAELSELKSEFAAHEWDPEGNRSYPLNAEEARVLVRGLDNAAKSLLRTFSHRRGLMEYPTSLSRIRRACCALMSCIFRSRG